MIHIFILLKSCTYCSINFVPLMVSSSIRSCVQCIFLCVIFPKWLVILRCTFTSVHLFPVHVFPEGCSFTQPLWERARTLCTTACLKWDQDSQEA